MERRETERRKERELTSRTALQAHDTHSCSSTSTVTFPDSPYTHHTSPLTTRPLCHVILATPYHIPYTNAIIHILKVQEITFTTNKDRVG